MLKIVHISSKKNSPKIVFERNLIVIILNMADLLTELMNLEFKEAFDEFDKVKGKDHRTEDKEEG